MKIKIIEKPFKPNSKILCPFDKYPCSRPRSSIDGDLQCGGIIYGDSSGVEEEITPACPRFKPENVRP